MKILNLILFLMSIVSGVLCQPEIPDLYSNISYDENKNLVLKLGENSYPAQEILSELSPDRFIHNIKGTESGLSFDFGLKGLSGKLYYGLIHYDDSRHPLPVYFKESSPIDSGLCSINIASGLSGRYDMTGWEESGRGVIGYRVLDDKGHFLYDGKVAFKGPGPFDIANTIIEGPVVDRITHESAIVSFKTSNPLRASVQANSRTYLDDKVTENHEILLDGLNADSDYSYSIEIDGITQQYTFITAPAPGSRKPFTFAYASDSRSGQGGGERDIHGTNAYIMKKILALANQKEARFMQFTGDMIDGYLTSTAETRLQYTNWKRAIEPWTHYMPVYEGMGNHEAVVYYFPIPERQFYAMIERFPFDTESAEVIFAEQFVNPENGPSSEDGASYDPNPDKEDFPTYAENVFYYAYDNVAVINLNSDYFYVPTLKYIRQTSGNLHGYIMDNQLEWLEKVLLELEEDANIDHVFVTQHTPAFPNGGHVGDDMWYDGKNDYRPFIAGKPLSKGIIERREEYLDLLVNKSSKVLAILTGDEHNYCRTEITPDMPRFPETGYFSIRTELSRSIYQINNGAAGAPYYAQQETPWTANTHSFTTQNALVLIHVEGKKVKLEVLNPDTLEKIDELVLRE